MLSFSVRLHPCLALAALSTQTQKPHQQLVFFLCELVH